ncbi:glycosyltransferase family 2 protein [Methanobacterium sp. SMA-27]|uniref:glycosyltransferase family 2 protein n=1 Tax=Methanobacterium sp. SMA-27 TaxID=1495336 RepID=UPI00064EF0FB|nr:glycosyltransferase family 2 protein [Methanobacterium sp. SMA-27]
MDLSIIIVNYETYDLTKQAVESVIKQDQPFSYDIYLVDNGSKDGSIHKLKEHFLKESEDGLIKFILNNENRGFAYANNLALKKITSEYILLLNSDTIIVDKCLEDSLNYIKNHKDIGALGCKVVLPDNTLDMACRRSFPDFNVSFYKLTGLSRVFPKSERFGRYNLSYLNEDETYEVDCIVGAFMLVRSQAIKDVGFLDESFFMYGEDIDWCYRIKAANWKIIYFSDAKIIHYKGASNNKQLTYEFYRAMYIFYNKHYKDGYPWITTAATYLGIWGICSLKMFKNYITR